MLGITFFDDANIHFNWITEQQTNHVTCAHLTFTSDCLFHHPLLFLSQELRKKLAEDKIKRTEKHETDKDKAYDPMARFKFGG